VRILVIGSGGREHAIVRALAKDKNDLHAAPGNPGIAELAEVHPSTNPGEASGGHGGVVPPGTSGAAPRDISDLARKLSADLVVIGPEAPLVAGAADAVTAQGIACFGPSQRAAMIEGSKSFAKQLMNEAGIPTARSFTCATSSEVEEALRAFFPNFVVKDDALAAGKGVVVTTDIDVARAHAASCGTVVIEEFLDGPEVSLFAITDGITAVPLLPAQDFKRAGDGDQGPNTGGMGAYAPLPWAPPDLVQQAMASVIQPAVDAMRRRGTPYRGLLYAGLCLTADGIRVIEFNARFGDPETQVVLDRLATPLTDLLYGAATGDLAAAAAPRWHEGAAVTVVVAAEGYPGATVRGDGIRPWGKRADAYVLQAGTALDAAGELVSAGGRVLDVVGTGADIAAARAAAYELAGTIEMRGGWYRGDIAAGR
jgi:phosphoribosylamine--glycine ligase